MAGSGGLARTPDPDFSPPLPFPHCLPETERMCSLSNVSSNHLKPDGRCDESGSRGLGAQLYTPDRTSLFNPGEHLGRQTSVGGFQGDNFERKKTKENNWSQTEHPSLQSSGQSVDFNSGDLGLCHPQLSDSDPAC